MKGNRAEIGLYLCVFDGDEELEGVEVGLYADFDVVRQYVVNHLESGHAGVKFPTFILHSDCDGEWGYEECQRLKLELREISAALKQRPPLELGEGWQKDVARSIGLTPRNAFESMIDVDGEFLFDRLEGLVEVALNHRLPILFQ